MLASVDVRSRLPGAQFEEKTDMPKGEVPLPYWLRCGIEPARNRDKRAALWELACSGSPPRFGDGDLNGLGDGVGREVLFATMVGRGPRPLAAPPGEKRDGTVPARARLVDCGLLSEVWGGVKSGKPSVGDSGMFSRRGVELPLVGGPQTLIGRPSWA